jgi:[ribosomal protein S5]-alanine N-acetyltransferase
MGFRRWSPEDFPFALSLWGDAEVTRLIGGGKAFSEEKICQRLATEAANHAAHGVQYWPIFQLEDDDFVGCCGLRPFQLEERIFEMGFHLRPVHWRKGYAEEAGRAAAGYAFDKIGAKALFAGHHPENFRSGRVLEKLGFRYTHHRFYEPTGLMHPAYLLSREDFHTTGK